ncbi:MAG TPA: hypothetical protein VGL08_08730 [Paraburkholderia sp.]
METRTTKVETSLENVQQNVDLLRGDIKDLRKSQRSDFHITWTGLIGLAAILAKGFHWF